MDTFVNKNSHPRHWSVIDASQIQRSIRPLPESSNISVPMSAWLEKNARSLATTLNKISAIFVMILLSYWKQIKLFGWNTWKMYIAVNACNGYHRPLSTALGRLVTLYAMIHFQLHAMLAVCCRHQISSQENIFWIQRVWTVLNGGSSSTGTMEILHVRTGCQVTWTPFNAGDAVPVGAVEGGYLSSSGANLYVMRAPFENYILIGYYDSNSVTGYMSYWGMKMVTNMELLVLL